MTELNVTFIGKKKKKKMGEDLGGGGGVEMYSFGRDPEAGTGDTELREALLAPGPVGRHVGAVP